MKRRFETVDVFTNQLFGGNPLAVVLDAEGLSTDQMQNIAAEFNYSETTFVLPPSDPAHSAEVRIFTPKREMPFAGHPNVGTAYVLAKLGSVFGKAIGGSLTFEEKAGLVKINLTETDGQLSGARLISPQPFSRGVELKPEDVARAVSLNTASISTVSHAPCVASTGAPFVIAELKSREALDKAEPNGSVFADVVPMDFATSIHLYVQEKHKGADIQARMFAPLHNIREDPATGSANVALIGLLASLEAQADLTCKATILQGEAMGRPSYLHASAIKKSGEVVETAIGGECVPFMSGTIEVD